MSETYIAGYELMQLPCKSENWQNDIAFTELTSDLGEGMSAGVLYGSNTGNQSFRMNLQLKDFSDAKTVSYNGQMFTPAEYLWDLFCRTRVTGTPFVIQNLRNSQYYLVDFSDPKLSYEKVLYKMYSTGIELKQARRPGVTVFDVSKLAGVWGWYKADALGLANGQALVGWNNSISASYSLSTANLVYSIPAQNGRGAVVFNGTNAYAARASTPVIKQIFIALKINSATFANYGGIVTNSSVSGGADAALVGAQGTTKFTNFSFGANYVYRKNSIAYSESDQQAPMNKFGVVHARHKTGFNINYLLVGSDRLQAGRYANMTIGEMIFCSEHISDSDGREVTEYLSTKWGI